MIPDCFILKYDDQDSIYSSFVLFTLNKDKPNTSLIYFIATEI